MPPSAGMKALVLPHTPGSALSAVFERGGNPTRLIGRQMPNSVSEPAKHITRAGEYLFGLHQNPETLVEQTPVGRVLFHVDAPSRM
jgi:hypothetical protein